MAKHTFRYSGKDVTFSDTVPDRIIGYFSPEKAFNRLRYRARHAVANAISGSYHGASKSRRALSEFNPRGGDADSDTLFDLPTLRDRSRDMIRNVPIAGGAINTNVTSVVGGGLKLQSRIDRQRLEMSEEEADAWEATTEQEFRLWADSKDCDVARTCNFPAQQALAFRSTLENGDVFALLPYIRRKGSPYGLKVQLIEADRISNKDNSRDTLTLAGGVEKDRYGAPIAYHIMDQHPGRLHGPIKRSWTVVSAFGIKTGRRKVLHLIPMLRVGQTRGVPYLSSVIEPLKQLGRYTDAELMAAVVSGLFTVFIKTESGDGNLALMEPTADVGGKSSDKDYKLGYGAMLGLKKDDEISTANPGRPNAGFDPFVQAILRQVGVELELPFEILIKHFTASYSAAQAALLEAWKYFITRRQWLALNFCQPVYETWMDEAVAIGRIHAPGYFADPALQQAYRGSQWIGPARGMIDPGKDAKAARERLDLRITTRSKLTAELTGDDYEQVHRQLVKEEKMIERDGLTAVAALPSEPDEPDEPDSDEEKPDDA